MIEVQIIQTLERNNRKKIYMLTTVNYQTLYAIFYLAPCVTISY